MSSTNRGANRNEADFYPTPAWAVRRILEAFPFPGGRWFEPAAGDGAIIRATNEIRQDVRWDACELRGECAKELERLGTNPEICDFLFIPPGRMRGRFDVILTNPPYSLAATFIEQCLRLAPIVAMPLRLNFLGSESRVEFWRRVGLPDVFVLPNRPDFSGAGGDSCEYAWFVFHPGQTGLLSILKSTPLAARRRRAP